MNTYERMTNLGISLPVAPPSPGPFMGAIRVGNQVVISGQVPLVKETVMTVGIVGDTVSIEEGQQNARIAILNALAQVETLVGDISKIRQFVRLAGYVAATPDFTQHGKVIDGASQLLREIFPDRWEHARIAIGVSSLPRGVPVEIELTLIVDDDN
ncbi:RidA family protein [Vreelandella nigrificans]|uniref:LysR family transcriptional regulator n=1 Tax=Vreelandella nigrificans TaxID=2042704 RepID=A0A2A4HGK6_9GAMM|nr:RidA family protein [Halomonas nigrificans]PCF94468.1 LysR family transcriptional regulator [Halomonas nigrificans]